MKRRGRRRHGMIRKESKTVSLDVEAIQRLEQLGNGCLSAGIAIAEHMARGKTAPSLEEIHTRAKVLAETRPAPGRKWIVFELVDGPADPPPIEGEQLDAWLSR